MNFVSKGVTVVGLLVLCYIGWMGIANPPLPEPKCKDGGVAYSQQGKGDWGCLVLKTK